LAGYRNAPDIATSKNVALVSGFSPSLLESILSGEDFSPIAIMERAIEKYKIIIPKDIKIEASERTISNVNRKARKTRAKVELKRPF